MKVLLTEDGYRFRFEDGAWTDGDMTFTDPDSLGVGYKIEDTSFVGDCWISISLAGSETDRVPVYIKDDGICLMADGAYGLWDICDAEIGFEKAGVVNDGSDNARDDYCDFVTRTVEAFVNACAKRIHAGNDAGDEVCNGVTYQYKRIECDNYGNLI